ncbi:MAG: hypothetical protein Q7T82_18930 [Armatimonadota bacterium]|nr:hypothetical protein [Armatimonadota bacterium]
MTDFVNAVISESRDGGIIHSYLSQQISWEGPMRKSFASLVADLASGSPQSITRVTERLQYLNGTYRTRYPVASMPCAVNVLVKLIGDMGWWRTSPPVLFGSSEIDSEQLANMIPGILDGIEKQGCKRPYSLLTKFLHFCFPDSFPIYDAQAASSIQMWSFLAFKNRDADWKQFRLLEMTDTSGHGYKSLVKFYNLFWSTTNDAQRTELVRSTNMLSHHIGGKVSILDLVDKLLWLASGDPLPLGLTLRH